MTREAYDAAGRCCCSSALKVFFVYITSGIIDIQRVLLYGIYQCWDARSNAGMYNNMMW